MLTLHGSFRTHPNYGTQFKAVVAQQRLPASASARFALPVLGSHQGHRSGAGLPHGGAVWQRHFTGFGA